MVDWRFNSTTGMEMQLSLYLETTDFTYDVK